MDQYRDLPKEDPDTAIEYESGVDEESSLKIEKFRVLIIGKDNSQDDLVKSVFNLSKLSEKEKMPFGIKCESEENPNFESYHSKVGKKSCKRFMRWLKANAFAEERDIDCIWYQLNLLDISDEDILCLQYLQGCLIPIVTIIYDFNEFLSPFTESFLSKIGESNTITVKGMPLADVLVFRKKVLKLVSQLSFMTDRKELVYTTCLALEDDDAYTNFVSAQQEDSSCKFYGGILIGVSHCKYAAAGASYPLPIPASGLLAQKLAIGLLCKDIIKLWNLCPESSILTKEILLELPKASDVAKSIGKMILTSMFVPLWLLKGIWEAPATAKIIIGSIADVTLPVQRMYYFIKAGGKLDVPTIHAFYQHYKEFVRPKCLEHIAEITTFNVVTAFSSEAVYQEAIRLLDRFRYVSKSSEEDLIVPSFVVNDLITYD